MSHWGRVESARDRQVIGVRLHDSPELRMKSGSYRQGWVAVVVDSRDSIRVLRTTGIGTKPGVSDHAIERQGGGVTRRRRDRPEPADNQGWHEGEDVAAASAPFRA
jgi:hypothetical protein